MTSKILYLRFLLILILINSIYFQKYLLAQQDSTYIEINGTKWLETESKHFNAIYREIDSPLIPHMLKSAENALNPLMKIFNYKPSEKIILNIFDIYDYGSALTTTVPHNYIRFEIEPMEHGYESLPQNDRFQWLLSHELVHVAVNDHVSKIESTLRSIFGKVEPEQSQPLTVPFSLLTNYTRYTPHWYQESIAVFMETWLNGGYGRVLGNFDEMYFRSMVLDHKKFPEPLYLENVSVHNSFLFEILYYLYGERFASYLAYKYGSDKLISWYKTDENEIYEDYKSKFKMIFERDFDKEWNNFILFENKFQKENITRLSQPDAELTPIKRLTKKPIGWISEPHINKSKTSIIFSYHNPDNLAGIGSLNLEGENFEQIGTLPTPSILQVSSTAYDENLNLFFYTTNNNQLYRDIWAFDVASKEKKMLFENCRGGNLTISPSTHDLWGTIHSNGKVILFYSPYPYETLIPIVGFDVGNEFFELAISPSGKFLTGVLRRSNGSQSIIISDAEDLKNNNGKGGLKYETITFLGSPENPS